MGPDRNALAQAQLHSAAHGCGIACVESTGDVGGADEVEQLLIPAKAISAEAFAHITIQVNTQNSHSQFFNFPVLQLFSSQPSTLSSSALQLSAPSPSALEFFNPSAPQLFNASVFSSFIHDPAPKREPQPQAAANPSPAARSAPGLHGG
jgi:hypothetical protein